MRIQIHFSLIVMKYFLFLLFGICIAQETIKVNKRCYGCGDCVSTTLYVDSCQPLCDPCSNNFCKGSYYLKPAADGEYAIKTYDRSDCVSDGTFNETWVSVYCDTCYYNSDTIFCPEYYLNCGSYWWAWTLGILFVVVCVCFGIVAVAGVVKRQQIATLYSGKPPEYVSYEEASHQSTVGGSVSDYGTYTPNEGNNDNNNNNNYNSNNNSYY